MVELKSPLIVGLQITGCCNLSCRYCYADKLQSVNIPFGILKKILDDLSLMEVFQVLIEGGEPFLHPHFLDIVEYGLARFPDIAILTNGTIYDEKTFKKLSELHKIHPELNLQISLDSHVPEINDKSRGKGKEVIKNIERFLSYGLDLTIATVVHSKNAEFADKIIDYFYPRIKRYHFMNIMPTKGNLHEWKTYRCEKEKIDSIWLSLEKRKQNTDILISYPCDNLNSWMGKSTIKAKNCLAGIVRCYITPNLDVVACNIADFSIMGNLRLNSFQDIWFSEKAENIRNEKNPQCAEIIA